jgi:hypothetical protein
MKRSIAPLLILLATMTSSGCLLIEKKTLVIIVPPESNEIHFYCMFEGISMWEDGRAAELSNGNRSQLSQAKADLNGLKKDGANFFMTGVYTKDPPEHCRVEKLRFFLNPERERRLCADRRITLFDRAEFIKNLNEGMPESFETVFAGLDAQEIQEKIKKWSDELKKESSRKDADESGPRPLLLLALGLMEIVENFDLASIKRLQAAAKDDFRWIRIDSETIRLVLPATPECAKRIVTHPKAKDRLKELRKLVEPIDLEICDEGLAIVLGKKGQAIRLTYVDTRSHRVSAEAALACHAGSPTAIKLDDGKPANPAGLIEQFIAEKTKQR